MVEKDQGPQLALSNATSSSVLRSKLTPWGLKDYRKFRARMKALFPGDWKGRVSVDDYLVYTALRSKVVYEAKVQGKSWIRANRMLDDRLKAKGQEA